MSIPSGIIHCPVTTFNDDGTYDFDKMRLLLNFHVKQDPAAICLLTPMAEVFSLRPIEERKKLVKECAKIIGKKVPFYVHVTASGTQHAVELAKHAEAFGAAGVLLAPPYYWRLSWKDVEQFYSDVASSVGIDVIIYNMPMYLRNESIPVSTIANMVKRLPNVIGIVEASFVYKYLVLIKQECEKIREDFSIIPAVELIFPMSQMGCRTFFSSTSAVAPQLVKSLLSAVQSGDNEKALVLQNAVSLLLKHLKDGDPVLIKAAYHVMGRDVGGPRLPLRPLNSEQLTSLGNCILPYISDAEPRGW
jgi:4-hydroxy-tetrahydrodipicolinate synthase